MYRIIKLLILVLVISVNAKSQTRATSSTAGGTGGSAVFSQSPQITTPDIQTGFKIGSAAASGKIPIGNGTNYVASTPTYPNSGGTIGQKLTSDGTNFVAEFGNGSGTLTSATSGIANTETKIVSSDAAMAANRLQAGTQIVVILHGTCTSTGAGAGTIRVRYGTAATTADGVMQAFTLAAAPTSGTAVPFTIRLVITIKTTGASATSDGGLDLINNGTTGLSATETQVVRGTATNINTTTAATFFTVTYISGNANTTSTFQDCHIFLTYK